MTDGTPPLVLDGDPRYLSLLPLEAVSFTAARELDHAGAQLVMRTCDRIVPRATRYITGGARGGDALIGHYLAVTRREAEHVVVLPANRSQTDPWWEPFLQPARPAFAPRITLIEMPAGTTYEDRNTELVARGNTMFGFPAYLEGDKRSVRSGTWQAIRMARRAGKMNEWHCTALPGRWGRG